MKIKQLINFGRLGAGERANRKVRWLAALGVVLAAVGVTALSTLWIRSTLAQRSGGGDATGPSELALQPEPMKALSGSLLPVVDAVDATDNPCTTSTAFADMPGMSITYKQGGAVGSTGMNLVLFQGEWIPNTGRAELRLLVDGVVQSGPGDAASPFAATEGPDDRTAGFNFITDRLKNGTSHTVTIQWASVFGDSICVDERSLAIFHR